MDLGSPSLAMAGEKLHDCVGEAVVAIAGDHVAGATDVDEINVRETCNEFVGSLLGDEIAHLAAHKKAWARHSAESLQPPRTSDPLRSLRWEAAPKCRR